MTTDKMTLEQAKDRAKSLSGIIREYGKAINHDVVADEIKTVADAIDAHLVACEVSDEDVHVAIESYVTSDDAAEVPRFEAIRAALQADRQRVGGGQVAEGGKVPDGMWRISKLIEQLTEIKERFGNTCVWSEKLSWGATALHAHADHKAMLSAKGESHD